MNAISPVEASAKESEAWKREVLPTMEYGKQQQKQQLRKKIIK